MWDDIDLDQAGQSIQRIAEAAVVQLVELVWLAFRLALLAASVMQ